MLGKVRLPVGGVAASLFRGLFAMNTVSALSQFHDDNLGVIDPFDFD